MKKLILVTSLGILSYSCSEKCDPILDACSHIAPTDEACLAVFERWFYNSESNECEKIVYSGCSQWGFESEVACQDCLCD